MNFRLWLEKVEKSIPSGAIKVHLPVIKQQKDWSCGASIFRSICEYFKIHGDEKEFINLLDSDKSGTWPQSIIKAAAKLGLHVDAKNNMSIDQLKNSLDSGRPVICAMQAWGSKKSYYENNQTGHYVAAIGYDEKNIYFEDPYMEVTRGFRPIKAFDKHWHDKDAAGNKYIHLGIAIWKKGTDPDLKKRKAKLIT